MTAKARNKMGRLVENHAVLQREHMDLMEVLAGIRSKLEMSEKRCEESEVKIQTLEAEVKDTSLENTNRLEAAVMKEGEKYRSMQKENEQIFIKCIAESVARSAHLNQQDTKAQLAVERARCALAEIRRKEIEDMKFYQVLEEEKQKFQLEIESIQTKARNTAQKREAHIIAEHELKLQSESERTEKAFFLLHEAKEDIVALSERVAMLTAAQEQADLHQVDTVPLSSFEDLKSQLAQRDKDYNLLIKQNQNLNDQTASLNRRLEALSCQLKVLEDEKSFHGASKHFATYIKLKQHNEQLSERLDHALRQVSLLSNRLSSLSLPVTQADGNNNTVSTTTFTKSKKNNAPLLLPPSSSAADAATYLTKRHTNHAPLHTLIDAL